MQTDYYQVQIPFQVSVIYHFNAPVSQGEYACLPQNMVIWLDPEPIPTAPTLYAWPYNEQKWEPVFAPGLKGSSQYAGYSFVIDKTDIKNYCRKISLHDIEKIHAGTTRLNTDGTDPEYLINTDAFSGCLLGTAVGDSIGLPFEGLSAKRVHKFISFPLDHQFLFGTGMLSDDTEHSIMVAQVLTSSRDIDEFKNQLAWKFRFWLLALPAGIGKATLQSILKLLIGYKPDNSGVYSAGNGPMMRSAIIGVYAGDQPELMQALVHVNSHITHCDPSAEYCAQIIAQAAWLSSQNTEITAANLKHYFKKWIEKDNKLNDLIESICESIDNNQDTISFCQQHGMAEGVSGYCYETLAVVLHLWLSYPNNLLQAVTTAVKCGGDTDTVAAIVGGIIGAHVGRDGIPKAWLENLYEWPMTVATLDDIGIDLAYSKATRIKRKPISAFYPILLVRNLFFLVAVLVHGFRRFLPPY